MGAAGLMPRKRGRKRDACVSARWVVYVLCTGFCKVEGNVEGKSTWTLGVVGSSYNSQVVLEAWTSSPSLSYMERSNVTGADVEMYNVSLESLEFWDKLDVVLCASEASCEACALLADELRIPSISPKCPSAVLVCDHELKPPCVTEGGRRFVSHFSIVDTMERQAVRRYLMEIRVRGGFRIGVVNGFDPNPDPIIERMVSDLGMQVASETDDEVDGIVATVYNSRLGYQAKASFFSRSAFIALLSSVEEPDSIGYIISPVSLQWWCRLHGSCKEFDEDQALMWTSLMLIGMALDLARAGMCLVDEFDKCIVLAEGDSIYGPIAISRSGFNEFHETNLIQYDGTGRGKLVTWDSRTDLPSNMTMSMIYPAWSICKERASNGYISFREPLDVIMLFFNIFGSAVSLLMSAGILWYRNHGAFRALSVPFAVCSCLSTNLVYFGTVCWGMDNTEFTCAAAPTCLSLGFAFFIAPLAAKAKRIILVFSMRAVPVRLNHVYVFKWMCWLVLPQIILIASWMSFSRPRPEAVVRSSQVYYTCQGEHSAAFLVGTVVNGVALLFITARFAIRGRKAWARFNETWEVLFSVHVLGFTAVAIMISEAGAAVDDLSPTWAQRKMATALRQLLIPISLTTCLFVLFGPRFWEVWGDRTVSTSSELSASNPNPARRASSVSSMRTRSMMDIYQSPGASAPKQCHGCDRALFVVDELQNPNSSLAIFCSSSCCERRGNVDKSLQRPRQLPPINKEKIKSSAVAPQPPK